MNADLSDSKVYFLSLTQYNVEDIDKVDINNSIHL